MATRKKTPNKSKAPNRGGSSYVEKSEARALRQPKTVVVEDALDRIFEQHGTITTDLVLKEGAKPNSPLHQYFEWDDTVAAQKWRAQQAYSMIAATKYVLILEEQRKNEPPKVQAAIQHQDTQVRKFIRNSQGGFGERQRMLSDEESRALLVEGKVSALVGWCRSTVDVPELKEVRDGIQQLLARGGFSET